MNVIHNVQCTTLCNDIFCNIIQTECIICQLNVWGKIVVSNVLHLKVNILCIILEIGFILVMFWGMSNDTIFFVQEFILQICNISDAIKQNESELMHIDFVILIAKHMRKFSLLSIALQKLQLLSYNLCEQIFVGLTATWNMKKYLIQLCKNLKCYMLNFRLILLDCLIDCVIVSHLVLLSKQNLVDLQGINSPFVFIL